MNTTAMTLNTRCRTLFAGAFLLVAAVSAASSRATVSVPASADSKAPTGIAAALHAAQQKSGEPDFLSPDEAFRFSALADGPDSIRLIWGVTDGYYLYRARIKASSDGTQAKLGELTLPTGETKMDEYFGKQEVYHHDVVGSISVARSSSGDLAVPLKVTYQGCASAGLCYPPITKVVNVVLPSPGGGATHTGGGSGATAGAATGAAASAAGADTVAAGTGAFVSEQDKLAILIRDGNLAAVLATFFGIGLLLSLTPCVLPMIPILSGIIVGQGGKVTPGRGFSLAFTYAQGMALTYAAAGAIFVLVFKQAPQAFFQQPWIIMLFVALFVALAFAMFGAYTLQMPSALQTRLTDVSNQQKSGSYVGCFVMGALSALVVTACVAPALIAALSVISQTGKIARGAAALYVTGLGMGVPLLLVGASAGSLLPKVGPWMDTVKSLFGVLFLALAIYFLQPLISAPVGMLLWSALAVIAGFWIFALKARDGGPAPAAIRAAGLLALVYGIILLIGVAAGSNDPLQPLSTLRASNGSSPAAATKESALAFETIKSLDDLNKRVAAATAAGRPVMLDFYADWCTSCKEMERYTFSDKTVQAALSNAVLLHADVTKNDAVDQELLQHFGIFGPPTIAFYGPDGEERRNFRVVGYMKAAEFASLASRAFRPNLSASSAALPGST
ncbi:MAG: thioredoxin:protein disulfide reductase [Gammaproteobacteria bacterium]|jgi:thiol:disulfide interchange protein DsbD|nr:thioredoxin:protein disulfide reductase [Gammaproteobacteria bacterium]